MIVFDIDRKHVCHMTYPKGQVIRLMKFGVTGRNVTS